MKYYIEIDDRDIDRFRIDKPCKGTNGHVVLVLKDKYNMKVGFELLEARPHGEWIEINVKPTPFGGYTRDLKCNRCNRVTDEYQPNFCPNCGADMREGDDA